MPEPPDVRLEGSCVAPPAWIRVASGRPGVERIAAGFRGQAYDPHRHDTFAIGLTLAGVQSFDYRGARADSRAGGALVIHPDERHDGRAGGGAEGFSYHMAYVAPRLIRDALGPRAGALPALTNPLSRDPRLVRAVRALLADLDAPLEPLAMDAALADLADALLALDQSAARTTRAEAGISAAIERARAHLDAHAVEGVRSQTLEDLTGLDRYTLARQFRRRLGTSPHRYLVMRRLDRARDAIRAGTPLAEAALAAGFADQSHLTRHFASSFGMTPGMWARVMGLRTGRVSQATEARPPTPSSGAGQRTGCNGSQGFA